MNWEPRLEMLNKVGVSSFSLSSMEQLLIAFGRPDDQLKFVHIAGTKGKGSSAVFLAYILRACGYRVGLYTSPHLHHIYERMRVLEPYQTSQDVFEGMISEEEFTQRALFYQQPVDDLRKSGVDITWFEYMTAFAISWFAKKNVQIVVLETGLGGRLDATNVVETCVCGITPIGLEHTAILGDTLSLIAQEKAGIIRCVNQRVVLAQQQDEAMKVLKQRCESLGIRPDIVGQDVSFDSVNQDVSGCVFHVTGRRQYQNLKTLLLGEHQVANATFAIAMAEALEIFGFCLNEDNVKKGVLEVKWPGRFEKIKEGPLLIIDSAHTVESARCCVKTFEKIFPHKKYILLFGSSGDKDIKGILKELSKRAKEIILTRANHPRAVKFDRENIALFLGHQKCYSMASLKEALHQAEQMAHKDDVILVVGSVFLAGEVRAFINESKNIKNRDD